VSTTQALHVNAPRAQVNTFARVPSTLRTLRAGIVALCLLVAATGFFTWHAFHSIVHTIGYESEPSIVAAENIRGTLSDAHTDFLRAFVSAEGTNGKSISDYRAAIELANDYLVAASQNIAYGEAERQPILRALDNLSLYQTLEGSALADGGNIYDIRAADDVIREHIIPAVDDLAAANFAHLDNAYSDGRTAARIWLIAFCAVSIALLLLLLHTQRYLLATFRRVINPWIAAGTVALVLCAIAFGACGTNFLSNIRIAKEDAFDSVFALSQAKALAYNAHSQESIYLLTRDKDEKAEPAGNFQRSATMLLTPERADMSQLSPRAPRPKSVGLLNEELDNITFDGEEQAARATVAAWLDYARIDSRIRDLESSGLHSNAVALDLGTTAMESEGAFERFVATLNKTTDINQDQFDAAVARATNEARLLWILLIPLLLAPLLGSVAGIQQRLAEFRE